MRPAAAPVLSSVLLATAAPALAQAPPPSVSPTVTVVASKPPEVAATYPAQGATVAPGLTVLKVVFNAPMDPDAWGFAKGPAGSAYPECVARPRLLNDRRSFVLLCSTAAKTAYVIELDGEGSASGFASAGRRPAKPTELRFSTSGDEPVRTLDDAMKAAGLSDEDNPIASWKG